jgi:hypothetical protein
MHGQLQARIDTLRVRVAEYPDFRMQGADTFRLRVGGLQNHLPVRYPAERALPYNAWTSTRHLQVILVTLIHEIDLRPVRGRNLVSVFIDSCGRDVCR